MRTQRTGMLGHLKNFFIRCVKQWGRLWLRLLGYIPFVRAAPKVVEEVDWSKWATLGLQGVLVAMILAIVSTVVFFCCLAWSMFAAGTIHYFFVKDAPFSASLPVAINTAPMFTEQWRWHEDIHQFGGPGVGSESAKRIHVEEPSEEATHRPIAAPPSQAVADRAGDAIVNMLKERAATHLLATGIVRLLPKHEWKQRHVLNTNDDPHDDFHFAPQAFSFSGEADYDVQLKLQMPVTPRNLQLGPMTATVKLIGDPDPYTMDGRFTSRGKHAVIASSSATASMSVRPWLVRVLREWFFVMPFAFFGYAAHDTEMVTFDVFKRFHPPQSVLERIRGVNITLHAALTADTPQAQISEALLDVEVTTYGITYLFRQYPLMMDAALTIFFLTINCSICSLIGAVVALYMYSVYSSVGSVPTGTPHLGSRSSAAPNDRRSDNGVGRLKVVKFDETKTTTSAAPTKQGVSAQCGGTDRVDETEEEEAAPCATATPTRSKQEGKTANKRDNDDDDVESHEMQPGASTKAGLRRRKPHKKSTSDDEATPASSKDNGPKTAANDIQLIETGSDE